MPPFQQETTPDPPVKKERGGSDNEDEDATEENDSSATEIEEENYDDYVRPRRRRGGKPQHGDRHRDRQRKRREMQRDSSGSDLPEEVYAKRTCRTRGMVSYQFKEYDDLIKSAIQEDLQDPRPPRPRGQSTYFQG
jgi:hypothetical protein